MGTATHIKPFIPPTNRTSTTLWLEKRFDREDADPLGFQRVFAQLAHDTFGTKDIQDANTATHSWVAGQVGHMVLGGTAVVILLFWQSFIRQDQIPAWYMASLIAIPVFWFAFWIFKERNDYTDTLKRAGSAFDFNKGDVGWSAVTALFYIGIGELLAVVAYFAGAWVFLVFLAVSLPVVRVAYWWLRRKLALQQAGLPYFFRLANFGSDIGKANVDTINQLANVKDERKTKNRAKARLFEVLFKDERRALNKPAIRHLLISGPPDVGKMSLAVGVGNEFALSLQLGRYLTATKLLDLLEIKPKTLAPGEFPEMEEDAGRLLWPWRWCDLLIIDDVHEGASPSQEKGYVTGLLFKPSEFKDAIAKRAGADGLAWLGERRSVWVVTEPSQIAAWRTVIAALINVGEDEILTVELQGQTSKSPELGVAA